MESWLGLAILVGFGALGIWVVLGCPGVASFWIGPRPQTPGASSPRAPSETREAAEDRPAIESPGTTAFLERVSRASAADLPSLLSETAHLTFSLTEPNPVLDALRALVRRLGHDALPLLVAGLKGYSPSVAAVLLEHLGGPEALSALAECVETDAPGSHSAAASLGRMGGPEAVALILRRILKNPRYPTTGGDWRRTIDVLDSALIALIARHGPHIPEGDLRDITTLPRGSFRDLGVGEDGSPWVDDTPYYRYSARRAIAELERRGLDPGAGDDDRS